MSASSPQLERLFEVYDAFAAGRLECIPEYFTADASYRPSGVFPGMRDRYLGHEGISDLWHASTEPWEWIRIETGRTHVSGTDVVAQIWLHGRGLESKVEVHGVEAGHLVRFRDLKIVEFLAFPTWEEALAELRAA
jgi:ketosteroid isomerase-like protein